MGGDVKGQETQGLAARRAPGQIVFTFLLHVLPVENKRMTMDGSLKPSLVACQLTIDKRCAAERVGALNLTGDIVRGSEQRLNLPPLPRNATLTQRGTPRHGAIPTLSQSGFEI